MDKNNKKKDYQDKDWLYDQYIILQKSINQIAWKTGKNNPMYGKKPHNWNPNREEVYAPYGENFYNNDYRRYKWKLQGGRDLLTGEKLIEGIRSHYHHIDYNKSNDNPDNHCWLRRKNHNKISGYQSNLIKREYYKKILQKNTELIKQGKIPESWAPKNIESYIQENLVQLKLDEILSAGV